MNSSNGTGEVLIREKKARAGARLNPEEIAEWNTLDSSGREQGGAAAVEEEG